MQHSYQQPISNKTLWTILFAFLAIAIISYIPALEVPFYLDDRESIQINQAVQSDSLDALIDGPNRMRIIGYMSFWLNYQMSGLETASYHWTSLIIHLVNFLLVFGFCKILLNHFYPKDNGAKWALIVACIWLIHPLNSQAVIYIVQRLASIAAIFYLLAAISYIRLRQSTSKASLIFWTLVFVASTLGGLHSKQNFVAVFVFLFCWELFTARALVRHYLLLFTVSCFGLLLLISPFISQWWELIDQFTRDPNAPSRVEYFYTQSIVLWQYISKVVLPWPLQLEIDVVLQKSFSGLVLVALTGHILILTLAYRLRQKLPLVLVGVLFFYCSHIIESSFIPIKDLAFEHRTYIGNIGLLLALAALLRHGVMNVQLGWLNRVHMPALAVISITFCVMLFSRATLWQDPLAFYANEVEQSPGHARANYSYGNELLIVGKPAQAEVHLRKGFETDISNQKISASGLSAYIMSLYQQEKYQTGAQVVMLGLEYVKWPLPRSALLTNAAYGYIKMGYCDFALGLLRQAVKLNPANKDARGNINYCLAQMNKAARQNNTQQGN